MKCFRPRLGGFAGKGNVFGGIIVGRQIKAPFALIKEGAGRKVYWALIGISGYSGKFVICRIVAIFSPGFLSNQASGARCAGRELRTRPRASSQLWLAFAKYFSGLFFVVLQAHQHRSRASGVKSAFAPAHANGGSQPASPLGLWRRKTAGRAYHLLLPVAAFRLIRINLAIFGKLWNGIAEFPEFGPAGGMNRPTSAIQDNCSTKIRGDSPCRLGVWLHCFHFVHARGKSGGSCGGLSIK